MLIMQQEMEDAALTATFPKLEQYLEATGARPYCVAPIVSDEAWDNFVARLPHFEGEAELDLIPGATRILVGGMGRPASRL